jgi:hypothetical protein
LVGAVVVLLAGYLVVAHGCHNHDADDELSLPVPAEELRDAP